MVHALCAFGAAWGAQSLIRDVHTKLKVAVSMNKRRFFCKKTLFDLDLTYICDRVLVMAMPCVDGATAYRNDIREVARFFASRHYGHFLVVNLCEEHEESGNGNYDCSLLYEQVSTSPLIC